MRRRVDRHRLEGELRIPLRRADVDTLLSPVLETGALSIYSVDSFITSARFQHHSGKHLSDAIALEGKRLHEGMTRGLANVARQAGPESIKVDEDLDFHQRQLVSPEPLNEFISMFSQLTST